uniref:Uncharacterized protein n=1 Tax=Chrysotila carterae TaxID=13221 RepID=A0A7S4AZR4_CHRCT
MEAEARLRKLEAELLGAYEKGKEKNVYNGGYGGGHLHADSFAEVEAHEKERRRLAALVKEAREEAKKERQRVKMQAGTWNEPSSWTAKLLEGDARFASAVDDAERKLAQATYGLKTAAEFRGTRERLQVEEDEAAEAAAAEEARQREQEAASRREAKKRRRRMEASKLSFDDED